MRLYRGDIWLVRLGDGLGREQRGTRPAVIVTSDRLDQARLGLAIVVPGTTTMRLSNDGSVVPNHLAVDPDADNGLVRRTYFMTEQVRSLSVERCERRLGCLTRELIRQLEIRLLFMMELPM